MDAFIFASKTCSFTVNWGLAGFMCNVYVDGKNDDLSHFQIKTVGFVYSLSVDAFYILL